MTRAPVSLPPVFPPLASCLPVVASPDVLPPFAARLPFRPVLAFAPELPPLEASPVAPPPPFTFAEASPVVPPFAFDVPPVTVFPPFEEVASPPLDFATQSDTLQVSALPPAAFDELSTIALASPPLPPLPATAVPPVEVASPLAAVPVWFTVAVCA